MRNTSISPTPFTKNYFSIIKELKQRNIHHLLKENPKKPLTKITEGIYSKYSTNIESYIKKNKNKIQFRGTTKYDNITIDSFIAELQIYKQTILDKIKDNPSLIPTLNEPVSENEIILTPLPEQMQSQTRSQATLNDKQEKSDFDSVKRSAKVMRVVEYTHRFKRENMHPKKNIFSKRSKAKKPLDYNKAVFYVMKNAVEQIENWWMNIKKKNKKTANHSHHHQYSKHGYNIKRIVYLQKWFKKSRNRLISQSNIQKPLIVKCYIDKMVKYSLYYIITLQNEIRRFLQRGTYKKKYNNRSLKKGKECNEKDIYIQCDIKEPMTIIKIKPSLIYKVIKLKPELYLDENDVVSFRDMNEHSINLQSFNISHNESVFSSIAIDFETNQPTQEFSFVNNRDNDNDINIKILLNKLTKICFESFIQSLITNNKFKGLIQCRKVLQKRIVQQYLTEWKNRARIDSYSEVIQMNKSKKLVHSFVYKSKRLKNKLNYTLLQIQIGLNALSIILYLKCFQKIKQRQLFNKCNLFLKLLSKRHKEYSFYKLLLMYLINNSNKINTNNLLERNQKIKHLFGIDIINVNYKGIILSQKSNNTSLLFGKDHLKQADLIPEESDEEIIEQDDNDNSSDTLTEKESLNGDDNHYKIIPQEIKNKFLSRNLQLNKPDLNNSAHNKSIDNTTPRTNIHNTLFQQRRIHTKESSRSVDRLKYPKTSTTTKSNVITIRDGYSIDYENMI